MDYRLGAALLFSVLLHATALLGTSPFNLLDSPTPTKPAQLEIILAPKEPPEIPQKPNTTVDENKIIEKHLPPKTIPSPPPKSQQKPTKATLQPSSSPTPMAKEKGPAPRANSSTATPVAAPQPLPVSPPVKTGSPALQPSLAEASEKDSSKSLPSARELIAALEGQLAKEVQRYAIQPSKRYIDSSTREYAATAYLDSWRKKIERVGKLNYPEEAKRQGLSGSLVLVVDLYPDGTVANIIVRQSSGYHVLDEAAIRIVQLAAPFAQVPKNVLHDHDILSITRTWQFRSGEDFSSN